MAPDLHFKPSVKRTLLSTSAIIALSLLSLFSCGRPSELDAQQAGEARMRRSEGQVPFQGEAAFASQCPYGSTSNSFPVPLELWDCPFQDEVVSMTEPMKTLIFSADCKEKLLSIRTADRTIDRVWEVMPDGSFNLTFEGVPVSLAQGAGACSTPTTLDMWGQLECADRDKVLIRVEMVWWLGREYRDSGGAGAPVTVGHSGLPGDGASCSMPSNKCYLHAITKIQQCQ